MTDDVRRVGMARLASDASTLDTRRVPIRQADHNDQDAAMWQSLLCDEGHVTIPPHAIKRVLIDLSSTASSARSWTRCVVMRHGQGSCWPISIGFRGHPLFVPILLSAP